MSVELGSVWIDNDSDLLVIVKSLEAKFDGKVTVIFNYIVRTGDKSIESASELELFLKTKTKLVRHNDSDYEKGYVEGYNQHEYEMHQVMSERELDLKAQAYEEGYDSGRNQWQDDYGFTVPNNTVQSLEKAAYAKGLKKGKEFNKDDQNLNYRAGYNDGWHDCEASFELGNEFTDGIQEQAYDEGYDQAINDLIEAGVIEEEEYSDEECYSEYEFGAVEDDEEDGEEEYCFSKELDKILNNAFVVDNRSDGVERKHSHYFKDVRHLDYIDVYELNKLFPIDDDTDCILHARKKLLVCGGRGGSKDMITDITDARDTLNRYLQIEGIE